MKSHKSLKKQFNKTDKQMIKLYHKCIAHYLSDWELEEMLKNKNNFGEEMRQERILARNLLRL